MSGEIPIDVAQLRQLIKLYKGMVTSGDKYIIHQRTLENGVVMIEWTTRPEYMLETVFLLPNKIYQDDK
jgi:hypothetical protein